VTATDAEPTVLESPLGALFAMRDLDDTIAVLDDPPDSRGRVLGSVVMAASVLATSRRVDDGHRPVAIHGTFVRAGVAGLPLELRIDRVHDGRSVSVRLVRAQQGDRTMASCTVRFHRVPDQPDPELEWSALDPELPQPPEAGRPDDAVVATLDLATGFDVRAAVPPGSVERRVMHPYWARARGPLPEVRGVDEALLVALTDFGVSTSAARPHLSLSDRRRAVTLDHALWWHRPVHSDRWMLIETRPQLGAVGRGLTHGTARDEDGAVIASFAQEVVDPQAG
jgi:acyl-CoA thioesterase-2